MRILQITPTYPPAWSYGGITRVVNEISKELSRRGHDVEVWASDALDRYSRVKNVDGEAETKVRYFKNLSFALTRMFYDIHITPGIISFAKNELCDFDVVHLHGARTFQSLAVFPFVKKYSVPYILQAHGTFYSIGPKQMLHWIHNMFFGYRLLRDASKVIALSRMEADQYMRTGVPEEKIEVIPNGIDLSEYDDLPPKRSFKKKFGLAGELALILYVGRVHKRKGIGFLLDAFAQLRDTNTVLVIVGPDDGYMSVVKEKASRLGIAEKVVFTGFVSERVKLAAYVDSEVVVYPGIYECFPLVPLEAALCSKPVIVSDDSVMGEIVTHGGFGLSIRYGNVEQLRDSLLRILNNLKIAGEKGRKGRAFVKRNYNWGDIVSKLERVYLDALVN